jgi:hypothetical protein
MRIPMLQNYSGLPGGAYNAANISNAQSAFAPMQAAGNALLPMEQAQYMPYQMQLQAMSNPMLWMLGQQNPQMMQQVTSNIMKSLPQMNKMNSMPFGGGGLLGDVVNHIRNVFGQSQIGKPATQGMAGNGPVTSQTSPALAIPSEILPLIQKAGITGATAVEGRPGWYHGYQGDKSIYFRNQP